MLSSPQDAYGIVDSSHYCRSISHVHGGNTTKVCVPRVRSRAAFENTMKGFDERGQQIQDCNLKMHHFIISLVRKGVFPPLEKKLFFPKPF